MKKSKIKKVNKSKTKKINKKLESNKALENSKSSMGYMEYCNKTYGIF